jgi:hypothetical protein
MGKDYAYAKNEILVIVVAIVIVVLGKRLVS